MNLPLLLAVIILITGGIVAAYAKPVRRRTYTDDLPKDIEALRRRQSRRR